MERPRTVVYCRMSLDVTGEALGIERQEKECRAFAEQRGWPVDHVFTDNDLSATTGRLRPGFEELLDSGAARIVVWHTDRLARLPKDLERVIALEVPVYAVTAGHLDLATPAGRAVARTLTAWATYEGEQKAERMRAQQRQRRESGKPWWSVRPFGFEQDGTHRETEASALRAAFEMLDQGETFAEVCRQWNDQGLHTTGGNPWSPNLVRQTLGSPRNAGLITQRRQGQRAEQVVGKASWEPIIEPERWRSIIERASQPTQRKRGQGQRKGLLSGIATCGVCGEVVHVRTRSRKTRGAVRKVYGASCGHATVDQEWLDAYVVNELLKFLVSPIAHIQRGKIGGEDAEAQRAVAEVKRLRQRLDEVADAYAEGEITRDQMSRASSQLREQLAPVEAIAERAYRPGPLGDFRSPARTAQAWKSDALDLKARQVILRSVFAAIVIHRRKPGQAMTTEFVALTYQWQRPSPRREAAVPG